MEGGGGVVGSSPSVVSGGVECDSRSGVVVSGGVEEWSVTVGVERW